jgi:hypothetical protein
MAANTTNQQKKPALAWKAKTGKVGIASTVFDGRLPTIPNSKRNPMLDDIYFQGNRSDPNQPGLFDHGQHARETSQIARASAIPKQSSRRERIENYIRAAGKSGRTRDEISVGLSLPIQSVCPPVLAMLRSGRLIETNQRRNTRAGKPAAVITINPNGNQ